ITPRPPYSGSPMSAGVRHQPLHSSSAVVTGPPFYSKEVYQLCTDPGPADFAVRHFRVIEFTQLGTDNRGRFRVALVRLHFHSGPFRILQGPSLSAAYVACCSVN